MIKIYNEYFYGVFRAKLKVHFAFVSVAFVRTFGEVNSYLTLSAITVRDFQVRDNRFHLHKWHTREDSERKLVRINTRIYSIKNTFFVLNAYRKYWKCFTRIYCVTHVLIASPFASSIELAGAHGGTMSSTTNEL